MLYRVVATYKYDAEDTDELSFEKGEIISVVPYDDPETQVSNLPCLYWTMAFDIIPKHSCLAIVVVKYIIVLVFCKTGQVSHIVFLAKNLSF